jgi:hypothetical protein
MVNVISFLNEVYIGYESENFSKVEEVGPYIYDGALSNVVVSQILT